MAENIEGARLVELPGLDHIPFVGDADGVAVEVQAGDDEATVEPDNAATSTW